MGSKYTDAQKNASIKYLDEKTDSIQIRTPKGTKERWREAATAILVMSYEIRLPGFLPHQPVGMLKEKSYCLNNTNTLAST